MWQEIVRNIREKAGNGRELSYQDGAIGITALLHCPIKWELSQKYDLKAESPEIDDGFVWEGQVKSALKELFGSAVEEEKDLIYKVGDYTLHGHLDVFVEKEDEVIGIELKAPKFLLLKAIPESDDGLLMDDGIVIHNPVYLKQAQIQRFLLERLYPHKRVRQYLFYKALCKHKNFSRKLYVVSEVRESISEEELIALVRAFHEDKSPRYVEECEKYCVFYKEGLCEGKAFKGDAYEPYALELLREYRTLQADLKLLESHLKKAIKGTLKIGGKELGWVEREVVELDIKKLLEKIDNPEEYLQVKWQKRDLLISQYGKEIVKSTRKERVWKL
ncbi:MAG: hypothetical protein ACK42C_00150 [Aquificaceae bacterium]